METETNEAFSKVPEVTLLFWIIKILATTLGETGGDALSMSMNFGYLVSTVIFALIFVVAVVIRVRAENFTRSFIGRLLSPRPRWARHWQISRIVPWALGMPAGPQFFLFCS
jgi:hypothetical protein